MFMEQKTQPHIKMGQIMRQDSVFTNILDSDRTPHRHHVVVGISQKS